MKRLQGILILAGLIVVFFLPDILRPNAVYAPADMIYLSQPWRVQGGPLPHNVLQGDGALMFIPFRKLFYDQIHEHRFPLWNPYIYGGAPFFANDQSGVLSVFNLVSLPFSFTQGFLVMAVLRLLVAGVGMYLLLDLFGLDMAACLLGSMAWTFSAYMIMYLHLLTSTAAGSFIPWMLYFFERIVRSLKQQGKSTVPGIAGISAAVGLSFLSGHAETTAIGITGLMIYAVVRIALWKGYRVQALLLTATGVVLGTGIAAVQLLPFVQILLNSEPLLSRTASSSGTTVRPLSALLKMWFVPYVNANATFSYWWDHYLNHQTFVYAYIGMAPLVLAFLGIVKIRKNGRQTIPFIVTGLVALGITMNLPPFSWILHLPLFAAGGSWYYLLTVLSMSVLAGFGMQSVLDTAAPDVQSSRFIGLGAAAVLVLLVLVYAVTHVHSQWAVDVGSVVRMLTGARYAGTDPAVTTFFIVQFLIVLFFLAGTIMVLLRAKQAPRTAATALVLLTAADLFLFGMNYNPDPPARDLTATTPLIQRLKQLSTPAYTVYAGDDIIVPNLNMNYGIRFFSGYDITVSLRYQRFLFALFPKSTPVLGNNGSDPRSRPAVPPDHVIASIAGIRYLLFTSSTRLNPSSYKLLGTDEGVSLWENPDAKPLVYLADSVQPVASGREALAVLSKHEPGLLHTALVEGIDAGSVPDNANIRLTRIKEVPGEHVLRVNAASSGFLVVNEPSYPGWHAYIGTREVPLYHVNYLFQGIELPAGSYTVKIVYAPRMFSVGLILSLVTSVLVIGILVLKLFRSRN